MMGLFLTHSSQAQLNCIVTDTGKIVCGNLEQETNELIRINLRKKDGAWTYAHGRPKGRPTHWDVIEIRWDLGKVITTSAIEAKVQIGSKSGCIDKVNIEISQDGKFWKPVISQTISSKMAGSTWAYTKLGRADGNFKFRYIRTSEVEKVFGRACALDDVQIILSGGLN